MQTHSQKRRFQKSLIALAVTGISTGAYAQEEPVQEPQTEEEMAEVIEVRGQRGNLMRASDMKREAGTFLDAIDASDISALPDTSILEALQRVPGVAIERFAARNDPDHFSTEGTGIVIRGLSQTRSEFNGRSSFSANSGRGLSFADVPPELVGSVLVYKNQMAELIEGGISGTIDLRTRKAFDSPDRVFAFNAEYVYGDLREEGAPQFSFLFSDRMQTDNGEWGFLVNYTKAEVKFQSDGIQTGVNWDDRSDPDAAEGQNAGNPLWVLGNIQDANGNDVIGADGNPIPQRVLRGVGARRKQDDRDREGGSASIQWRSPDENTLVTAEYIRSDSSLEWTENSIEIQRNENGVLIPVEGTDIVYDENGYMTEGLLTAAGPAYRSNVPGDDPFFRLQNTQNWGDSNNPDFWPRYGSLVESTTRFRRDTNLVEDFSLNVKHEIDDTWFLEFDAQRIEAEASVIDHTLFYGQNAVMYYKANGDDVADIGFYDPQYSTDPGFESQLGVDSPNNAWWRAGMPHSQDNDGEETAFMFDAKRVFESGFIESIKTGVRYSKRDQTTRESAYHWKHLHAAWHDGGPAFLNRDLPTAQALADFVTVADFSDMQGGAIVQGSQFMVPTIDIAKNYGDPAFSNLLKEMAAAVGSDGYTLLNERVDNDGNPTVDGSNYLREEINTISETNTAFYLQANYAFEVGDVLVDGNFGVRYVDVDTETDGFVIYPDYTEERAILEGGPDYDPNDYAFLFLPEADRAFGTGSAVPLTFTDNYTNLLPSFNMRIELADDMFVRLAAAEAIAYPNLGQKRGFLRIGADEIFITREVALDENGSPILDEDGSPVQNVTDAQIQFYRANGGNPAIQPMESINYDASFEWYFDEGANFIVSLFYKDLKNFFLSGDRGDVIQNPTTGAEEPVVISGPTNGQEGSMKGYELAYQQFFGMLPAPFDGLGVQANYTYLSSDGIPNPNLDGDGSILDDARDGLPLEQLSEDTVNLVLLYEKNALHARLAYNWRSDFLLTARDVITRKPIFNEATGQLDGSIFYDVTDNISVGVQGVNLTNETIRTTMLQGDERLNRSWFENDRRFSLIVRGTF
ncbi:TonB-dependent receptor [Ningiella sp. W23]|uniref:TonB-dependent receptor n=1 Tax=Ningiella sp. W23 TaxID=3023715 RepID=UPI0037565C44